MRTVAQPQTEGVREAARRRVKILNAAEYTCETCECVAWSFRLADELTIREDADYPDHPHVFCKPCAVKFDARAAKRHQRRAS